ncbi:glycine cleavage system aminomethyltransferase GcvT [Peredibacter starrii]|uniref:Aminomethyltransferase n=1 Tax=Peredibacter starrii TaxID=28202 RepID=A0AAX4HQ90_9BACT|nr:glycine cleavage system aminomethyltransferase GcvT [Peredibacter starrii]WPU65281.1 glycine cleavage system aminomethyltransferase GcvT [Peredibacter starrii]
MTTLKTYLYDEHVKLGGKIVPFAGWDMPVQYSSVKDEVLAVRNNVGVFDVSHMGEFFVEGEDAEAFVDGLVTNDIQNAPMGKAIYSPLCRENGTVIDDLIVYKLAPGHVLVCVNAGNIDKDFAWFKSKHTGFKCNLTNRSNDYSLLAIQGPKAFEILKPLLKDLPEIEYYSVHETAFENNPVIVARTGYTGEDGFEVFGTHEGTKALWQKLMSVGVTPCGLAARDVLRLEVCYPLYGHELNDEVNPYDAGLGWTVKGAKTNFIGKEALAPKKANYKLVKLILEKGIPREGYPVLNSKNEPIGVITSGTMSVVLNKGIAFARIQIDKAPSDEVFMVDIRQKPYPAQLTKKPFVTGGHK